MANRTIIKGEVGNALTSIAPDHILGVANDIFDEQQQEYQQDINAYLYSVLGSSLSAGAFNTLAEKVAVLESMIDSDSDGIIDKFNEIVSFLSGISDENTLNNVINAINTRTGFYICTTDADVADKTVSANGFSLISGGALKIKMSNVNISNNVTLNIGSTGAKALMYNNERASSTNSWKAGEVLTVYYDASANSNAGAFYATNILGGAGDGVFDVSKHNNDAPYTSLNSALAAVPAYERKAGMSIKFIYRTGAGTQEDPYVDTYVQYRYMNTDAQTSATFTNVANWQGVDVEPTAGSHNLVESGGVIQVLPYMILSERAENYTYYPVEVKQGNTYRIQKTPNFSATQCSIYMRVQKTSTGQSSAIILDSSRTYADFVADKDYNYLTFYNSSITAGRTQEVYFFNKEEFLYNSIIKNSTFSTNEMVENIGIDTTPAIDSSDIVRGNGIVTDFIDRVGGKFLTTPISVVSGQSLSEYRDILIKAGTLFKVRLIPTDIISTNINIYIYYEGENTGQQIGVYNDGNYYQLRNDQIQNKNIVKIRYDNAASRNIGTGNIYFEFLVDNKFVTASDVSSAITTSLIPIEGSITSLNGQTKELDVSVNGIPAATINPGYIVSDTQLYYAQSDNYKHLKIDVNPGQNVSIVATTTSGGVTDYVILKTYPELSSSIVTLDPVSSSTGRNRLNAGESANITIPSDGHYIIISYMINDLIANYAPSAITSSGNDLIAGIPSLDSRIGAIDSRIGAIEEDVASLKNSFLKYKKSVSSSAISVGVHPEFEFYQFDGKDKYFMLKLTLCKHTDDDQYQYLWRIIGGECYSANNLTSSIGTLLDSGENEWACNMKDFYGIGGHVGGVHGAERIDLDTENCFVRFFADGKLLNITSDTEDFTINCNKFEYIQKSALYIVNDRTTEQVVSDHPKYAYHTKITKFENCGYDVENIVEIIPDATIPYSNITSSQYFSFLSCIGKDVATSVLLPNSVLSEGLNGSNNTIQSDNLKANRILFWNPTTELSAEAGSEILQGIDDATMTNLDVWDRDLDSKYYRYKLAQINLSDIGVIRSRGFVIYK